MPTTWDLANASYDSGQFLATSDVGTQQPYGVHFKPDGTKLYVCGFVSKVGQYNLATPWDLTTATFVTEIDVSSHIARPYGLHWRDDGSSLYVIDDNTQTGPAIYRYVTTTNWEIADIQQPPADAIGINSWGVPRSATGLWIKEDGTDVFFSSGVDPRVWRKRMNPAWDLNTLALIGGDGDFTLPGQPYGPVVSEDGTQLLIADIQTGNHVIRSYTFGTPFDPTTLVDDGPTLSTQPQGFGPSDIYIPPSGTVEKMFVTGASEGVYRYSLPAVPPPGGGWGRIPFGGS